MNLRDKLFSPVCRGWKFCLKYKVTGNYISNSLKLSRVKPLRSYSMSEVSGSVANNVSSSLNPELPVDSSSNKRPCDDQEHDEDWVKRIQLDPEPVENTPPRRKRRKFALLLSYSGKGYLGMQRNPGFKTIEDEILMAMLKSSLVTEEGVTCPQIHRFQRAARTDKGVSAVRQIISLKIPDDVDIPSVINEHLPEQIKIMKAVRVTQGFDSKLQCDSRTYSYLTPTFAFSPSDETNEDYRMTTEVLKDLRKILEKFKGVHNFFNFTAKVKYTEHRASRYIMDISCSDPFIRDGLEWTLIKIKGQSFMRHQIRKMVGFAICLCKGRISHDLFDCVWTRERVHLPITPGLGLTLEEPHYDYYNRKYCKDGWHEALLWDAEEEKIQAFREEYIDSVITKTEKEEKSMLNWLETLELHSFFQSNENQEQETSVTGEGQDCDDDDNGNTIEKTDPLNSKEAKHESNHQAAALPDKDSILADKINCE